MGDALKALEGCRLCLTPRGQCGLVPRVLWRSLNLEGEKEDDIPHSPQWNAEITDQPARPPQPRCRTLHMSRKLRLTRPHTNHLWSSVRSCPVPALAKRILSARLVIQTQRCNLEQLLLLVPSALNQSTQPRPRSVVGSRWSTLLPPEHFQHQINTVSFQPSPDEVGWH